MGLTTKGFRWPAATDRVADGALAIEHLAEDVDAYLDNLPRGVLREAHFTGNTAQNITAAAMTTLTGTVSTDNGAGAAGNLAVTQAVKAGRRYKVTLTLNLFSTVTGDIVQAGAIASAGTLVLFSPRYSLPSTSGEGFTVTGWYYPAADGNVTFSAQAGRFGGTGNINAGANTSIAVEDCGKAASVFA